MHAEPLAGTSRSTLDITNAIYVASGLAAAAVRFDPYPPPVSQTGLDPRYLDLTGFAERVPDWCLLARSQRLAMLEPV